VSIDPLSFLEEYRAEATEHVTSLDAQLLRLERDPTDAKPIRAMFLAAHTIKGGAAMLGLTEVLELSHALEDVLGILRDGGRPLDASIAEVMFRAVDQLQVLIAVVDGAPHPSTPATVAIVSALTACIAAPSPSVQHSAGDAPRVLLVEDSPSVRQVETFLLQDAGFIVDAAEAGNEAVERACTVQYVLVIAGIETRELRGPDLVRALRAGAAGPNLPALLTTTDPVPGSIPSGVDLVYAPKGRFGDGEFVRVVRELTARRRA